MTDLLTTLPRPRDVTRGFGIYVHVPFCSHRCWYCDFNAYAGLDHVIDRYMAALVRDVAEARSAALPIGDRPPVTSVFLGGGTPSLVDPRWIVALLDAVRDHWTLVPGAEVTIECNPESVAPERVDAWLAAGVNRISIGVQSLDAELLRALGRAHDASAAIEALRAARAAGVPQLSADLIYGVPGESDETWNRSLEGVLDCEPDHLSCYALTYEEGTPLHSWKRLGRVVPVDDDLVAGRWEMTNAVLADAGFARYEISNWARPAAEARHNSLYWAGGEYLGLGAGAHSHLADPDGSVRSWTLRAPERYAQGVEDGASTLAGHERLDRSDRCAEAMMLGLRRTAGVTSPGFAALTGRDLEATHGPTLRALARRGLLTWDGRAAALTERGTLLANEAVCAFLD